MTQPPDTRAVPTGPEIITLGCRLNIAESETLRQRLAGQKDVVLVNSCAVTSEAMSQTRKAIRRARRRRPDARIIVTGCGAQVDPQQFSAMEEVDQIVGNSQKNSLAQLSAPSAGRVHVADFQSVAHNAPHMAASFAEHSRGFVEVQNGCDHRCTFCIIPFGRGPSRSVPAGAVIETVQQLLDTGHREIVLTGVDVTSYGHDLPGQPSLGHLVERILERADGLERLRLSSLDGVEIDDRLFACLTQDERVMPHVHLSMQSGADLILKRMKRRHLRIDARAIVERLKTARSDIAIGADLIAGFPTETEDHHLDNVSLIEECEIVHGHIFPYSPRPGTPAARMPQVHPESIKARAAQLRAAFTDRKDRWLHSLVGQTTQIATEMGNSGYTPHFARVRFTAPTDPGQIVTARLTGLANGELTAIKEI